ncbi:ATP-dependent endonuclease [Methylophilus sp. 13]|uniref:ATP-dependent endonuclease n=1 Tax=Methylophilus sp. 13 TaxID=2781018 RepID=UPI00188E36ED|nr:ATP-dependent endonuclease [Methylophilus sp. 13]MBF5040147.1 ATP-dependent endonuclease [Methylophilus sp. 13]
MKLEKIILKNFRGYRDETEISFERLTAFIGRNDAGKSTVLEALEIFFNNEQVVCEKDDLSINSTNNLIEIGCIFSGAPNEVVIDTANPTSLAAEYLLNDQQLLHIKKVFPATAAKPKEKVYFVCQHPAAQNANDLLDLKRAELRQRAINMGIPAANYNANVNASIRAAIRNHIADLQISGTELLVDKEDTKKVYEAISNYLPIFALFQSDRQSRDDDKEVVDPMKIAIQQALQELEAQLEEIKVQVREKAIETANRTLAKLQEMAPELARELTPEFRSEPNFASQFKLSIKAEDNIPINKRGSGVRRLVLLSFFRAEAERRRAGNIGNNVIYAFEEPETSQHPDHQEILIQAFLQLSESPSSQIVLTTHTPALAGLLPLNSLRFIERGQHSRIVSSGTEEVFQKVVETLGVLPHPIPNNANAVILVEGKGDLTFISHAAEKLREGGYIPATFQECRIALVPIGGCGNIKHWQTKKIITQFGIPYGVLLDSDLGTPEASKNADAIAELRADNIKAYVTRKREPENYIDVSCLNLPAGTVFSITDTDDAKVKIGDIKGTRRTTVIEDYWVRMSCEQIRLAEKYVENGTDRFEFTEMFTDFLSLANL